MEKVEKLYRDYLQSKISLQSLQFQLEPILGNFDSISKADEQFIKSVTNNLELIIYTIPEELQKDKVIGLFPRYLITSAILQAVKEALSGTGGAPVTVH